MKIILFGKNGQIARRLYGQLIVLGEVVLCGSEDIDFRNRVKLKEFVEHHSPDIIINAAAYTEVDNAESNKDKAFAVNADAVKILAEVAKKIDALLVHYSTEYVFDGKKQLGYTEADSMNPLNVYGASKAMADEYISSIDPKHVIFRISSIYDSYGKNFPKTILSFAKTKNSIKVIDDQFISPTSALLVANVTTLILYKILNSSKSIESFSGTYNIAPEGAVSWYEFATFIIDQVGKMGISLTCKPQDVLPISTLEYNQIAKRPTNSILSTRKVQEKFGLLMPKWELYTVAMLKELKVMGII